MALPNDAIAHAKEVLNNYLYNGDIQTWTSREIHIGTDENIIKMVERVTKQVKETPPWVIERVLGKSYDELEAVKTLVEAGWLPPEILCSCGASMEHLKQSIMQRIFARVAE